MTENSPQEQNLIPMLLALITLIIITLTVAIIFLKKDDIEKDLAERTSNKLQELGLQVSNINFSGRDGTVSIIGATNITTAEMVKQAEKNVKGVRSLTLNEETITTSQVKALLDNATEKDTTRQTSTSEESPPSPLPATDIALGSFSLKKENDQWSLTGTVHSDATKESLIKKISAKLKITDNIIVEEKNATLEWPIFLPLILSKLDKLQGNAEIRLDENLMVVQGTTQTQVDKQSILLTVRESFGNKISVQSMLETLENSE